MGGLAPEGRGRTGPVATALLVVAAWGPGGSAPPPPPSSEAVQLGSDLRVVVRQGRDVELELLAAAEESVADIARRATGTPARAERIAAHNAPDPIAAGRWIRVPLDLLTPELRSLALRALFPRDRRDGSDWLHVARSGVVPTYDEGLWQVAEWFAGRGEVFAEIMTANGLTSPELREGQVIRIPAALTHPAFAARPVSDDGILEYGTDGDGPFAAYRLGAGEALYSSVVLRFTGRTGAEDVGRIADRLLARSHLRDARDIPAGHEIKIPLELLEPQFLPSDHPRRLEAEARRAALERELSRRPTPPAARGLEGVIVILDPGHGGRDHGTMNHGIWEHDYVYDVACRLKRSIESETAARVLLTLEDRETGCVPSSADRLVANKQGTILTTPGFLARDEGEAEIGVNLRWYLANSIYRKAVASGTLPEQVVFVSLHADSRHPGLRGLMVYVPGASYRARTYGSTSATYARYEEVREKPTISFGRPDRLRSEAVSRRFAERIVRGFRQSGLPVQPYQPVRDKIIRGKSTWVPAVLRGNAVPTKVLVEMLNLSNREDAALLASAQRREQLARALHTALLDYFEEGSPSVAASVAAP